MDVFSGYHSEWNLGSPGGWDYQRINQLIAKEIWKRLTSNSLIDIDPGYSHFGKSLIPLLKGETEDHREAVFCEGGRLYGEEHAMEKESQSSLDALGLYWPRVGLQITDEKPYHSKATMCRTTDFKYVRRLYEKDEFYDLNKDPEEIYNIIDDPLYFNVLSNMKEQMLEWYMETCDVVPFNLDKRF